MAESTLSLAFLDLKQQAGLYLGWGRGAEAGDAAWTARKSALLDQFVKSGLRQFYFPMPMEKGQATYDWSFLRPSHDFTLASGDTGLDLPDDFGSFEGQIQVQAASNEVGLPLEITGIGMVRQLRSEFPTTTGRPLWCAVDPLKGTTATKGQRFRLEIYPIVDQAYTLHTSYYLHPDALSGDRPYAYGGMSHAETIMASILAAAELQLDDKRGERYAYFVERLATSISQDRRLKPQQYGYNGDQSDRKHSALSNRRGWWRGSITVNGTQY